MPALLSQTGAFDETRNLSPNASLIAYDLVAPFWSDGASKSRWIAVPNDGADRVRKIKFAPTGEWTFPNGTVFVQHFDLLKDWVKGRGLGYDESLAGTFRPIIWARTAASLPTMSLFRIACPPGSLGGAKASFVRASIWLALRR